MKEEITKEIAQEHSRLVGCIEDAAKVKHDDLTDEFRRLRLGLLKRAVVELPQMDIKFSRRLFKAACEMEFLNTEEINFRHHVSCAIAEHWKLRELRNKPITAPSTTAGGKRP